MATAATPRAVIVRRRTDYELLIAAHATRGQAEFFLKSRGQTIDATESDHAALHAAFEATAAAIPPRWRRAAVDRDDLDRFLFEPSDVVIAVGQDGLVANIAKYLDGQLVIGVNALPHRFDGVLARFTAPALDGLLPRITGSRAPKVQARTMVEAMLDDGQSLTALNEIFIGHRTHQSARYKIRWNGAHERHSSSGVIVATGTGATGWARSINRARSDPLELPGPGDRRLAFFVREAFPSVATGVSITSGLCAADQPLQLTSEMNTGGVVFGDGIEDDYLTFNWGQRLNIAIATRTLNLVVG